MEDLIMFIDIHAHAYRIRPPFGCRFCNAEELIARYDTMGVERGFILPIVSPEIYFPQANEDILEMVEKYPDRLSAFCNIDPRILSDNPRTNLVPVLEHYKSKGCIGIGEVMCHMAVMDPYVQNLFMAAEKVGLPVTFDGSANMFNGGFGLYDDPGLPQLEQTLISFPNLKMFGHGPLFWSEIAKLKTPGERGYFYTVDGRHRGFCPKHKIEEEGVLATLFRRYPNLYGDLSDGTAYSAITRDPEYTFKFFEEFQDRLCFGTDMVAPDMKENTAATLVKWRDEGKISETVFNKIARENAIRIFGLDK